MTTHLKQGWLRRNGVPESDQATLIERFTRHGRNITHTVIITDPVYLSEPMIRTSDFVVNEQDGGNWLWPCEYVEEISGRAKGEVPHHLPGANPFLKEFADRTKAPMGGVRGGPETIYPEYGARLKASPPAETKADAPRVSQAKNPDTGEVQLLPVQGNVYMLAGAGGNVVVQVGPSGGLLVDSKSAAQAERILAEVKKLSDLGKAGEVSAQHQRRRRSSRRQRAPRQGARVAGELDDHQHAGRVAERGADHRARQRARRGPARCRPRRSPPKRSSASRRSSTSTASRC